MTIKPDKKSIAGRAPQTTGVYLFLDGRTPLYIGKAVNLRARLLSHLENARLDPKEEAILARTTAVRVIPAPSEFRALVEEAELIRKYLPRYNKIWKDDKSYLYIKIAMREKYPRIRFARSERSRTARSERSRTARRERDTNTRYFGPFPSVAVVEKILREIRRALPYHSGALGAKPCFHSKIGLCNPCPNSMEQMAEGREKDLLTAKYRKNIRAIVKVLEGKTGAVLKQLYRNLTALSRRENYEEALALRNRIFLFEKFISEKTGIEREGLEAGGDDGLGGLRAVLKRFFPALGALGRIECYDISSLSQKQGAASMVVATDGIIDKSQYRRFRIRDKKLRSDFEMLHEVMRRRFALHLPKRGEEWPLPDLVVVDGGAPQVKTLQRALEELRVRVPVIGIAKAPDRLVVSDMQRETRDMKKTGLTTLRLPLNHAGFNLVRRLRDEAHRFSKKYHLLLRRRALFSGRQSPASSAYLST